MRYQRLIYMRGLPGAGKSTEARRLIAEHLAELRAANSKAITLTAVSRDEFRAMFHGERLGWGRQEQLVTAAQDATILALLAAGSDVIVHDTNLRDSDCARFERLADQAGARAVAIDLRHVSVDECVARDRARTGAARIGEQVIRDKYADHIANKRLTSRIAASAARAADTRRG